MIIIDDRFLDIAKKIWGKKHEIFPSFCHSGLQAPVMSHPDMTLTPVGDSFVCCPESYDYYKKALKEKLIKGNTELSFHYPKDIAYNVLIYKNYALGNDKYIDSVVLEELKKNNIKILNVSQGYTKCSCCVSDEGIITADEGIYSVLQKNNINALKIAPGHVKLQGYNHGFIGGASGVIDNKLTFFGDVSLHPDFDKIKRFCDFDYIKDFELTDVGTIFCI